MQIDIQRSTMCLLWLSAIHLMMLFVVFMLFRQQLLTWISSITLVMSWVYLCMQYRWIPGYNAIISLRKNEKVWFFYHQNAETGPFFLTGCVVNSWVLVLCFSEPGKRRRHHVVLFADALERDEFRALCRLCRNPETFRAR